MIIRDDKGLLSVLADLFDAFFPGLKLLRCAEKLITILDFA